MLWSSWREAETRSRLWAAVHATPPEELQILGADLRLQEQGVAARSRAKSFFRGVDGQISGPSRPLPIAHSTPVGAEISLWLTASSASGASSPCPEQ